VAESEPCFARVRTTIGGDADISETEVFRMNIGPFAFPMGSLAFFVSGVTALLIAWRLNREDKRAATLILRTIIVGLVVARIVFVLHYLPGYDGSLLKLFYDASGHLLETHVGAFSTGSFEETLARLYPTSVVEHVVG
jgi:uncharacterized membrane protein